jgi:hypothetical protein
LEIHTVVEHQPDGFVGDGGEPVGNSCDGWYCKEHLNQLEASGEHGDKDLDDVHEGVLVGYSKEAASASVRDEDDDSGGVPEGSY